MTTGRGGAGEALRARATLNRGVAVYRWAAFVWMAAGALTGPRFRRPGLAWVLVGATGVWTVLLSRSRARTLTLTSTPPGGDPAGATARGRALHIADLGFAVGLVFASAYVVPHGTIALRPFFATAYPAAAVLAWAVHGMKTGLIAAVVTGAAVVAARPIGGVPLSSLTSTQASSLANGVITYLLAGGAAGLVADLLARSARAADEAIALQMREAQRAARLSERATLARQIHDSILQALALVHKKGREMAAAGTADPKSVAALADLAGQQERALRALILRSDTDAPTGTASLRDHLEALALSYDDAPLTVSAAGAAYCSRHAVEEITAAVRQAVDNAIEHSNAGRITVFVDERSSEVAITIRDDGKGFDPASTNGFGLRSMRGRVVDLGGRLQITTAEGSGTEIEMIVPRDLEDAR